MQLTNVKIIKKNRVYFACEFESGCKFKLKIDDKSRDLEVGKTHALLLEDNSVRSKWGSDLIYSVVGEHKKDEIVTLRHFKYNSELVGKCKKLGGKWDAENEAWVFSKIVEDEVLDLDEKYNSKIVWLEIEATDDCYRGKSELDFCGYTIARAAGRDSGATLADGVYLTSGKVHSGGSMKNWATCAQEGTKIRLQVPESIAKSFIEDGEAEYPISFSNWTNAKILN